LATNRTGRFWNACAGSGLTSKWTRAGTRRAQFLVSGETAEPVTLRPKQQENIALPKAAWLYRDFSGFGT